MPITFQISNKITKKATKLSKFDVRELHVYKNLNGNKIIKCSLMDNLYHTYNDNGFVSTIIKCYNKHHNLILRPDDIWIAILAQFSRYIEANSEELRPKFVNFDGKKNLIVSCNASLLSAPYGDMVTNMIDIICDNLNSKISNWIIPNFTTTTETDKIAASVMVMASMQEYFGYEFALECGIPEVTMLGTVDDWIELREKAKFLLEYDNNLNIIKKWHSMLDPILEKFIQSISGEPEITWWQSITNVYSPDGSGSTYLSGWITAFCVFSTNGKWLGDQREYCISSDSLFGDSTYKYIHSEWPFINMDKIPAGYVFVPVKINDNGLYYESIMVAGHLGFNTSNNDLYLQPAISWSIFLINNDNPKIN